MVNILQALLITDELDVICGKACEEIVEMRVLLSLLTLKDRRMLVPLNEKDENREEAGLVRNKWGIVKSLDLNILILLSL